MRNSIYLVTHINGCGECQNFRILMNDDTIQTKCVESNKILATIQSSDSEGIRNMGTTIPFNCPLRPQAVKMSQKEFESIAEWVKEYNKKYPQQREGQSMFNMLSEKFPAIAETIRGTTFDPFYCDEKIQICYEFIYNMFVKE